MRTAMTRPRSSSSKVDRWLPVPGRVTVCQRTGCHDAALDDVLRLCAQHLDEYRAATASLLATPPNGQRHPGGFVLTGSGN